MNPSKTLLGGIITQYENSRKSALAEGVEGEHLVVTVKDPNGVAMKFAEVSDELSGAVNVFVKQVARERSTALGRPGSFRIIENGPDQCTRPDYHVHIIIIASSEEEIKALGLEVARVIDPAGLFLKLAA